MTYIIAEPCISVKDKACVEACPVDCIYEGDEQLFIHPDECIDCGACVDPCPVDAIYHEDELPEKWQKFYDSNVDFFNGKEGLEPARKDD
jgi:NAD-dependent dihydropyrimidine dehydrogenase PreA subunit